MNEDRQKRARFWVMIVLLVSVTLTGGCGVAGKLGKAWNLQQRQTAILENRPPAVKTFWAEATATMGAARETATAEAPK